MSSVSSENVDDVVVEVPENGELGSRSDVAVAVVAAAPADGTTWRSSSSLPFSLSTIRPTSGGGDCISSDSDCDCMDESRTCFCIARICVCNKSSCCCNSRFCSSSSGAIDDVTDVSASIVVESIDCLISVRKEDRHAETQLQHELPASVESLPSSCCNTWR